MAESSPSDEALEITTLLDLQDELLEMVCAALADDLVAGVTSLVRLARCSRRLHSMVHNPACIARCAATYNIELPSSSPRAPPFELLAVAETVVGLGTNRIFFARKGRSYMHNTPVIRAGSSHARLIDFALLLRRHPRLTLVVDGHEGSHEGVVHEVEDADGEGPGGGIRASFGQSKQRAEVVRDSLLELECLVRLSKLGAKEWGRLPDKRFGPRVVARGWEDAVAEAAGWSAPETCQAECFFSLDGIELPTRGDHYRRAQQAREANVGWQQHFAFGHP